MTNKFPDNIMAILRQRRSLEESDTSEDADINTFTAEKALKEVVTWEFGDRNWFYWFMDKAEDCGFKITGEGYDPIRL